MDVRNGDSARIGGRAGDQRGTRGSRRDRDAPPGPHGDRVAFTHRCSFRRGDREAGLRRDRRSPAHDRTVLSGEQSSDRRRRHPRAARETARPRARPDADPGQRSAPAPVGRHQFRLRRPDTGRPGSRSLRYSSRSTRPHRSAPGWRRGAVRLRRDRRGDQLHPQGRRLRRHRPGELRHDRRRRRRDAAAEGQLRAAPQRSWLRERHRRVPRTGRDDSQRAAHRRGGADREAGPGGRRQQRPARQDADLGQPDHSRLAERLRELRDRTHRPGEALRLRELRHQGGGRRLLLP